jgi:hypothetical protein
VVLLSLDLRSPALRLISGGIGGIALGLLVVTLLLARAGAIGVVLALLGSLYLGHLAVLGQPEGPGVVLAALALLFVGELSQWSIDVAIGGRAHDGVYRARALGLALLGLLALGAAAGARLASSVRIEGGILPTAIATIASVALLLLVTRAAVRTAGTVRRRDPS